MRRGTAIVGSVAAHVAVLVVIARWVGGERPRAPEAAAAPAPTPAEEPIAVAFLDEPAHAMPSGGAATAGGGGGAARMTASQSLAPAHETAGDRAAPPASPVAAPGKPHGSLYLHMRGPELHLDDAALDAILDHPLPPPPTVPRSGRLDSAPGGRGIVHDAVTTVDVEPDGTAHFHDKRDVSIHFHLPIPTRAGLEELRRGVGETITEWSADPYAETHRHGPTADQPRFWKAQPGQCDTWGDWMCEYEPMPGPQDLADGKLDLTSYLMRKFHVGDPFASRKAALLDATRPERAERGATFRAEQLARSAELVRRNLEQLWAATRDPAVRKAALFELWDECAEGDGALGEAGARARAEVIGWIGAHLPRGSAGAFTDEEIAAFSARKASKQAFQPYAR